MNICLLKLNYDVENEEDNEEYKVGNSSTKYRFYYLKNSSNKYEFLSILFNNKKYFHPKKARADKRMLTVTYIRKLPFRHFEKEKFFPFPILVPRSNAVDKAVNISIYCFFSCLEFHYLAKGIFV